CVMKFLSWVIALGSGTSGGTLAPLFTIGGALGAVIGIGVMAIAPQAGIDPRIAGLVGMAAMFAGSSRAMLASVVFAFETTQQPFGLLPLLGGCGAAYLISCLTMRNTIMTEKIARRGVRVPSEYAADYLEQITVGIACSRELVTLRAEQVLREVRDWLNSGKPEAHHQGFPVVDATGIVRGVLTRRSLLDPQANPDAPISDLIQRAPLVVREDHSLREAADHMVRANIGRLIVVGSEAPHPLIGIITRGDLLAAHGKRLSEATVAKRHLRMRKRNRKPG
ncbi:MAG: chloride channel protein, partial [Lysobacteraceae bacterium]